MPGVWRGRRVCGRRRRPARPGRRVSARTAAHLHRRHVCRALATPNADRLGGVGPATEPESALRLLHRALDRDQAVIDPASLPPALLSEVESAMAQADPLAEIVVDVTCPGLRARICRRHRRGGFCRGRDRGSCRPGVARRARARPCVWVDRARRPRAQRGPARGVPAARDGRRAADDSSPPTSPTGYLGRLAARATGVQPAARPRLPARFEPAPDSEPGGERDHVVAPGHVTAMPSAELADSRSRDADSQRAEAVAPPDPHGTGCAGHPSRSAGRSASGFGTDPTCSLGVHRPRAQPNRRWRSGTAGGGCGNGSGAVDDSRAT